MKILKGELENMIYPTRNQKWNYSFTKFQDHTRVNMMQKAFVRAFKIPVSKVKTEWQEGIRKINRMCYDADKKSQRHLN